MICNMDYQYVPSNIDQNRITQPWSRYVPKRSPASFSLLEALSMLIEYLVIERKGKNFELRDSGL